MARPFVVATLLSLAMPAAPLLAADPPAPKAVLSTYADIALAMYGDALGKAQNLDAAVDALVQTPTDATLAAAREAWLAARVPYQQTEVFRFGNPIVDEWEGRVNAWPLDEGLIDYVAVATYGDSSDENAFYAANVIANPEAHHRRQDHRCQHHRCGAAGLAARDRRGRGQCQPGLSRHRVPALGPGP